MMKWLNNPTRRVRSRAPRPVTLINILALMLSVSCVFIATHWGFQHEWGSVILFALLALLFAFLWVL